MTAKLSFLLLHSIFYDSVWEIQSFIHGEMREKMENNISSHCLCQDNFYLLDSLKGSWKMTEASRPHMEKHCILITLFIFPIENLIRVFIYIKSPLPTQPLQNKNAYSIA